MPSILVVDDDEGSMPVLVDAFGAQGYRAEGAQSASEALEKLEQAAFDVLLTDLVMPGMDGVALLEWARTRFPELVMVLMTGAGTVESAVRALKGGAADYVAKPFNEPGGRVTVRASAEAHGAWFALAAGEQGGTTATVRLASTGNGK